MKPSFTSGLAAVLARAVAAGIMASSNGKAIMAPAPRNTVLRLRNFLVINIDGLQRRLLHRRGPTRPLRYHLHPERRAIHDPQHNRHKTVVVLRRAAHDRTHGRHIGVIESSAQRIFKQFLGERQGELLRLLHEMFAHIRRATQLHPSELATRIDHRRGLMILVAPAADGIEVLKREPQRIEDAVALIARGIGAMSLHPLSYGLGLLAIHVFLQRFHARRRRMWRCARDVLQNPGAPLHRRGAVRVGGPHEEAALAEQAPTIRIRERHTTELLALDVRDTVLAGQPLVYERIVPIQQPDHALVVPQHAGDEKLGLLLEGGAQRTVELREEAGIRLDPIDLVNIQPLVRKVIDEGVGTRIGEHTPDLLCQHRGLLQLIVARCAQQLVIRSLATQEERQARGELEIAEPVGVAGLRVCRWHLDAIQELRTGQDGRERLLDAAFEAMLFPPRLVEALGTCVSGITHRTPIRAPREARDDLLRAGLLLAVFLLIAGVDLRATGGLADTARIARANHLNTQHSRHPGDGAAGAEWLELVIGLGCRARNESNADLVRTRLHTFMYVLEARADRFDRRRLLLVGRFEILRAAERAAENLPAVDRHHESLLAIEAGDVTTSEAAALVDIEGVFAVGGKHVLDEHATAGAER